MTESSCFGQQELLDCTHSLTSLTVMVQMRGLVTAAVLQVCGSLFSEPGGPGQDDAPLGRRRLAQLPRCQPRLHAGRRRRQKW